MTVRETPEKIPLFVLPCAIGFLGLGVLLGLLLAGPLGISRGAFLARFVPLFTWATTFGLALYLGHREPKLSASAALPDSHGSMWGDHSR